MTDSNQTPLLDVQNLKTYFYTEDGVVKAVDGVDFYVNEGEVLGLVGESGCGKSVTSLSIMRLVSSPGRIESGQVFFEGRDLMTFDKNEMVKVRGDRMSMIFQQPQTSLNPVFRIGDQIVEVFQIHSRMDKKEAWNKAVDSAEVGGYSRRRAQSERLPARDVWRAGSARNDRDGTGAQSETMLIADEPTTALDVTIQAQILDLMRHLRTQVNTAVILITHDLGVIAEMADRVAVMYAGRIVEQAGVE